MGLAGLLVWLAAGASLALAADAGRVALRVEERAGVARRQWPVTCGVPFARGVLRSDVVESGWLRVLKPDGAAVPMQARVAAVWGEYPWGPSPYARWVAVTFLADTEPGQASEWALEWGPDVQPPPAPPLRVERVVDAVAVTIGEGPNEVMAVINGADYRSLLEALVVDPNGNGFTDDIPAIDVSRRGIIEATCTGPEGAASSAAAGPASAQIVEQGPLRAVIRVEAPLGPGMRLACFYTVYAGLPCVAVDVVVRSSRNDCAVTRCSLSLPLEVVETADVACGTGDALLPSEWAVAGTTVEPDKPVILRQTGPPDPASAGGQGSAWKYQFGRGTEITNSGERAPGWVDVHFGARALMGACRDFWFSPLSTMTASSGELRIDVSDPEGGAVGGALVRDLLLFVPYDKVAMPSDQIARAFAVPLVAAPPAAYVCATQALSGTPLAAASEGDSLADAGQVLLQGMPLGEAPPPASDVSTSVPVRAHAIAALERDSGRDAVLALLNQYARTGDLRYRDLALAAGRALCESGNCADLIRAHPAGMAALAWLTADPWLCDTVNSALEADPKAWPVPRPGDTAAAADALLARCVAWEWTFNPEHIDLLNAACERALDNAPADGVCWSPFGGGFHVLAGDSDRVVAGWFAALRADPTWERREDPRLAAAGLAGLWLGRGTVHEAGLLRDVYGLRREIMRTPGSDAGLVPSDEMADPGACFATTLTMAAAFAETGDARFAEAVHNLVYTAGAALHGECRGPAAADALTYAAQALALLESKTPGR